MAKSQKTPPSVDQYLQSLAQPQREMTVELVSIIRKIKPRLEEGIKWNAPSFKHEGDDRLTLNLSAKDRVRLILHCGAKAGPKRSSRLIDSDSDLLEWASNDRAIMTFTSEDEVRDAKRELTAIIKSWLPASSA
ncbi:MAG: DUF1801 domain-containing protein [Phycisphaerales bacterium]|nr:DUF1801 domain-containing protein [Phycisphaerales bacterium]